MLVQGNKQAAKPTKARSSVIIISAAPLLSFLSAGHTFCLTSTHQACLSRQYVLYFLLLHCYYITLSTLYYLAAGLHSQTHGGRGDCCWWHLNVFGEGSVQIRGNCLDFDALNYLTRDPDKHSSMREEVR